MNVSINQLAELTGKTYRTIKHRLADLEKKDGAKGSHLYDSQQALELLYQVSGKTLDEAKIRELDERSALARARREVLDKTRIPIEIVMQTLEEVMTAQVAVLKCTIGKVMTIQTFTAIMADFRGIPEKLKW